MDSENKVLCIGTGMNGLGCNRCHGTLFEWNYISFNNQERFATSKCGGYCTVAGMKVAHVDRLTVNMNNFYRNNAGGLWFDLGCTNAMVTRNLFQENGDGVAMISGLFVEVSSTATVASNAFIKNLGNGIQISGSDRTRVYNNNFVQNKVAITMKDDSRKPCEFETYSCKLKLTWDTTDTVVRNNLISNSLLYGIDSAWVNDQVTSSNKMFSAIDHNGWYRTDSTGAYLVRWCPTSECTRYKTHTDFMQATNLDWAPPSIGVRDTPNNPFFVDEANDKLSLKSDSSAHLADGPAVNSSMFIQFGPVLQGNALEPYDDEVHLIVVPTRKSKKIPKNTRDAFGNTELRRIHSVVEVEGGGDEQRFGFMGDGHPDTYRGPVQQSNLTRIEEMSTGAAYCQLTDLLFLKRILLKKVKWNSRLEVDWLNNWRVLQAAWKDIGVNKPVTIQSLMKAKFQDNCEFKKETLQWFKKDSLAARNFEENQVLAFDTARFKTNMESLSPPLRELISRLCVSMVLQRIHSCAETCVDSTSQLSHFKEVQKLVAKLMHLIYNEDLETYKLLLRYHDSPKSKQMNRALKTLPHIINGEKVSAKGSKQDELILRVLNLSPETTKESLREFYSRFGGLNKCDVKKNSETGESMIGYVSSFASQKEQQYFNDVYGSQFPSLWSIAKSVLLCFVNGNEFFEMPRPISNKIIHIGGIASDVFEKSPAKKVTLSSEVQSVFDNAKDGVVLFSFGTITNTKAMTHQMKTAFLKAFAQFPSKQNAILAQPKLKIRTVARVMRVTELPDTITYQCCDTCEAEPDKTGVEDWFPIIRYFGVDDTMKREVLDVGTVVLAFGKLRTFSSKASIVSFHVIKLDAPEQEIAIFQKEAELHPLRGLFLRNYLLTSRPNTLQADTSSISEMNDFC